jgi:hypothetical protein
VPVVITDKFFLPWEDELDWSEFAVLISEETVPQMYDILKAVPEEYYNSMVNNAKKLYQDYFTLEGMSKQITKRLT